MRGEEGDLDRAKELGDRALELWPGEERPIELAEQYHMQANVHYWTGSYERSLELSERAAAIGGLDPRSAEFLLRGAGVRGLALAGLGRYEEAIAVGDRSIETARRLGRKDSGVLNYSTTALREVFALDEARERSETVVDRLGPSWFRMASLSARTDLIDAQLLMDDVAPVERTWEAVWDESMAIDAWERWIVTGRLAADRAEMELELGRLDDAVTWSGRALELATRGRRRKYEVMARIVLGRALTARAT